MRANHNKRSLESLVFNDPFEIIKTCNHNRNGKVSKAAPAKFKIQRHPAFKKVDFKKVRHCFSEKSLI